MRDGGYDPSDASVDAKMVTQSIIDLTRSIRNLNETLTKILTKLEELEKKD